MGGSRGVIGGGTFPEQVLVAQVSSPVAKTATFESSAIDCLGVGFVKVLVNLGACSGDAAPTLNGKMEEADASAGPYTDCVLPDGNIGEVVAPEKTDANANTGHEINFDTFGHKRWVKYKGVIAGTNPNFLVGVATIKGGLERLPAE